MLFTLHQINCLIPRGVTDSPSVVLQILVFFVFVFSNSWGFTLTLPTPPVALERIRKWMKTSVTSCIRRYEDEELSWSLRWHWSRLLSSLPCWSLCLIKFCNRVVFPTSPVTPAACCLRDCQHVSFSVSFGLELQSVFIVTNPQRRKW